MDEPLKAATEGHHISVMEPMKVFASIFLLAAVGGVAALLRSKTRITARLVISACLNSGLIGLVIALIWYSQYKDTNLWFLIGISVLAGLGGNTTIGFVMLYVRRKLNLPDPEDAENAGNSTATK